MTDVAVILQSLEAGSLPMASGLSALLMKSRDDPVEVFASVPFLIQQLSSENDLNKISIILNIFCELLGASERESAGDATAEAITKSNVLASFFNLLPESEFSVRFPLLRTLLYTCQRLPKDVQLAAVSSGIAIGQLTGILQDSREILRFVQVFIKQGWAVLKFNFYLGMKQFCFSPNCAKITKIYQFYSPSSLVLSFSYTSLNLSHGLKVESSCKTVLN